jgi:hypothetical protein
MRRFGAPGRPAVQAVQRFERAELVHGEVALRGGQHRARVAPIRVDRRTICWPIVPLGHVDRGRLAQDLATSASSSVDDAALAVRDPRPCRRNLGELAAGARIAAPAEEPAARL